MLLRHLRATKCQPAAPGGVDQRPRLVARRVLEGRSAGAAPERLRCLARGGDPIHLGLNRSGIARPALKGRADDDRAVGQFAVAIGVAEVGVPQGDQLTRAKYDVAFDKDFARLTAIGTTVHADEAADGAGNGPQELDPGDARVTRF